MFKTYLERKKMQQNQENCFIGIFIGNFVKKFMIHELWVIIELKDKKLKFSSQKLKTIKSSLGFSIIFTAPKSRARIGHHRPIVFFYRLQIRFFLIFAYFSLFFFARMICFFKLFRLFCRVVFSPIFFHFQFSKKWRIIQKAWRTRNISRRQKREKSSSFEPTLIRTEKTRKKMPSKKLSRQWLSERTFPLFFQVFQNFIYF